MNFLSSTIRIFREYKKLSEKAMAQIDDASLLPNAGEGSNSIVVIVKHLRGNMLSRWTNFLSEDGEKPWRQRDEEFQHEGLNREKLLQLWEEGWQCMFSTLESLTDADLNRTIHIRGEGMSAMDAMLRQLSHYSYHVGQIVLLCKTNAGEKWQSLTIPKGGSAAFNATLLGKQAPEQP